MEQERLAAMEKERAADQASLRGAEQEREKAEQERTRPPRLRPAEMATAMAARIALAEKAERERLSKAQKESPARPTFPRRPGERECDFYMQHGKCSYGAECIWDHPPRVGQATPSVVKAPEQPGAAGGVQTNPREAPVAPRTLPSATVSLVCGRGAGRGVGCWEDEGCLHSGGLESGALWRDCFFFFITREHKVE